MILDNFWDLYIVGETPLLVAAKRNDEIMIQFLLDLGAHPDVTDFKVWMVRVNNPKQDFKMLIYLSRCDKKASTDSQYLFIDRYE